MFALAEGVSHKLIATLLSERGGSPERRIITRLPHAPIGWDMPVSDQFAALRYGEARL